MVEEVQPSNVQEGADPPDALPANAEDRKAAAALSSLDQRGEDDNAPPKKEMDMKALGEAMKTLSAQAGVEKTDSGKGKEDVEVKRKPLVKVDQADVMLLTDQLDMSKAKATELLRAHDADTVKAMTAWVTAAV